MLLLLALADDCTPIRDAVASTKPTSGLSEIKIPDGVFTCHSPIVLDRDDVWLHGSGHTTLRLADNVNSPVVVMGDSATPPKPLHHVHISDLYIDGNREHQMFECWAGPCDSGSTTFIRNNGISVRGVTDSQIENVSITSARSGGVVTERGCFNLSIDGLTVTNSEFDGFAGYQTYNSTFAHMNLIHNQAAGISIDIDFSTNTVRDTVLESNGDVGVFMRDSNRNSFQNLTIKNSGNHGLFLANSGDKNTCVNDNEFRDLTVENSVHAGFRLNNDCPGNFLSGAATFRGNKDGCISLGDNAKLEQRGQVICEQ